MKSKFIKIRCTKCKNEQIMFEKAATKIKCLVCEEILSTPKGGKSNIKASIIESIK